MADVEKTNSKETIFSTSVAIFIVPAYIYLCSYLYEKGLCYYYGIPEEFIKPDLTTNLYFSIALFLSVMFVYFYPHQVIYLLFHSKVTKNPAFYPFLSANTILIIFFIASIHIATYEVSFLKTLIFYLSTLPFVNFLAFSQYRYIKKELETRDYNDIVIQWNKDVKTPVPILDFPDIFNLRAIFYGITSRQKHILLILIALVGFSYLIGKRDAYKKTKYEISTTHKGYALLRKYGDDLVLKNYNLKTKVLGDSIMIIKVGDPTNKFITKEIGKLKPSDPFQIVPSF
jgi:hypothetical protein